MRPLTSLLALLLFVQLCQAEDQLETANRLMEMGKYEQAIKHYELAINASPDRDVAYYNCGLAAYLSGKYGLAKKHWETLIEKVPQDFRLLAKLVQVHEKLDDAKGIQKYIEQIEKVHAASEDPQVKQTPYFCRDQFEQDKHRFMAFQYFGFPKSEPTKFIVFQLGEGNKRLRDMTFSSNPVTNAIAREQGTLKLGERLYHVEFFYPETKRHETYLHTKKNLTYREFKKQILEILKTKAEPITSSQRR